MKLTILFLSVAVIAASCNNGAEQQAAAQARQVDSLKNEMAKQKLVDSMNAVAEEQATAAAAAARTTTRNNSTTTVYHETDNTSRNTANAPATKAPKQRKGIGPVAAGAIIGAGAGAVTGAMVDKKKGEGAIIGGVLGAGAGAGTGAIIKSAQKKKDAKEAQK